MAGISNDLLFQLRQTLATCAEFSNDQTLRAVFIDQRINLYQNDIPQADSSAQRIDFLMSYLVDRSQDNKNGLVHFLDVLVDRRHDDSAAILAMLARELEKELERDQPKKTEIASNPSAGEFSISSQQLLTKQSARLISGPRTIINTVGKSALLNIKNYRPNNSEPELDFKINEIKAELYGDLLKREDWGKAAITRLVDWWEERRSSSNNPEFPLIPAEISALNAIEVAEQDTIYFFVGVSDKPQADEGEVCAQALVEYYRRRLPKARVEFNKVHGSIIRNSELVGEWEMLRQLDRVVSDEKDRSPNVPVIMNLTGGYRLNGIYAALVALAHGCEIYYIHEEMRKPVGLPAIDQAALALPDTKSAKEFQELPDKHKKFYRISGESYVRISLVNIVNTFSRSIRPN
jgi:putative CRISPR-associated protein (TIGR02619 family)